jgi:RNA polymerase sigma factor (sigma-70 family)
MFLKNSTLNKAKLNPEKVTEILYKAFGKKLFFYAKKTWNLNEDTSWDLINQTCFKVADKFSQLEFKADNQLNSFVFKVFINLLKNHFRNHPINEFAMEDSVIENISNQTKVEPEDESSGLKAPLLVEMENELAKLESWQKDLLLLRAQGLTYKEIANYLKKPTKNLKVYYGRLIHQLKVKLNS